jgi:hypothetical protein
MNKLLTAVAFASFAAAPAFALEGLDSASAPRIEPQAFVSAPRAPALVAAAPNRTATGVRLADASQPRPAAVAIDNRAGPSRTALGVRIADRAQTIR